jgi:hypothetical protein
MKASESASICAGGKRSLGSGRIDERYSYLNL